MTAAVALESPELQLAHVLFMDVVGYSKRPPAEQLSLLRELQELVRGQAEFRRASAGGDLLCLPTGDGMALVFFREPVAALQCAVELARKLRARGDLPLRMGIHSGPVYRLEDINAHDNVSGGGINLAQRVMDCGDAGHILLSRATAELIGQVGAWPLDDLGECEVKHGTLHLFNIHADDFGNPERPSRLRSTPLAGAAGQKVVLLYRRGADPDERLLSELLDGLRRAGCDVFWDRRIKIGMKWAEEISHQIRQADAVIPLLSEASVQSEMLAEELQIARDAALERGGLPRLLPIRVHLPGRLPDAVAVVVDPIEHASWDGDAATPGLIEDLVDALAAPPDEPSPPAPRPERAEPAPIAAAAPESRTEVDLEAVGGAVPLGSSYYVCRASDEAFLTAIRRQDSIVLVKGARQMGKTSLLARGLQCAREAGFRVVLTDLQWLNGAQLASAEAFFTALGEALADQLDLDVYPEALWNGRSGPSVNFQRYMRKAVLASGGPLVWGLDEVDRLFACPYSAEVFGLFRSWHNARALDPGGPWSQLTLAIAYATEAHLFITDVNQSPFNVGTRVALADFSAGEVRDLNGRYGTPLRGPQVDSFHELLNGHPYLTRRGLYELAARRISYSEFAAEAASNEGPFGDHLRRILMLLARDPALREAVLTLIRGGALSDADCFYRLRSAGVITGDSPRMAQPRCRLYSLYLEQHLL